MPAFCQAAGRKKGGWGGMPGVPGAPGLNPGGTGYPCRLRSRRGGRGGACLPCRCGVRRGLACFAARLPCLWFAFLPPIPPTPFPGGEGGDFYFISPGATAPGTPALDRLRHLQNLPSRCPVGGRTRVALLIGNRFLSVLRRTVGTAPGMQGAKPLASPHLNPGGTGYPCRLRSQRGAGGWSPACPAAVVPCGGGGRGGFSPSGTCSPCPGGEDHLKRRRRVRRIVPSPPVPPLLGCRHRS